MKAQRPDELKRAMAACRRVWAGIGVFSAFLNLLMLSVPIYMMQLYDRVLSTRNVDTLLALTVMVMVALLILGLLDALRGRVGDGLVALLVLGLLDAVRGRVLARVGGWLDQELGGLVLSGAVADALRAGGGVSAQGLRDLAKVRGYLGGPGVTPLFDAPWAPVFLAIIYLIHPVLGLIGIGGAVVLLVCAVLNDLTTRKKLTEANNASTTAFNTADAAVRNADAIAAMGMLPNLVRRWQQMGTRSESQMASALDASGSISATAKTLRFGLQVAMLGVGAYLVILHELTPGAMIAAAIILARGLAPVEQLINSWRFFTDARTSYRRLGELVARTPDEGERTALPRPGGRVSAEQVSYVPPGVREPVLQRASFRLDGGETLGIVGPSGAGKTTLVRLIVGSLTPTAGHVRLDDADVRAWPDEDRGRHVGYLPQNVELFAGTVRDNIARLGEAGDKEVVAAAQLAGAHEMILRLPDGYDTKIGVGGVPISGGQHQRIGLARAVFGNPALLVLDEPNAHLDADGEKALVQAVVRMRAKGTTVILIAQRAGIMAQVDKMLVLKAGKISAFGPRDEILDKLGQLAPPMSRGASSELARMPAWRQSARTTPRLRE